MMRTAMWYDSGDQHDIPIQIWLQSECVWVYDRTFRGAKRATAACPAQESFRWNLPQSIDTRVVQWSDPLPGLGLGPRAAHNM